MGAALAAAGSGTSPDRAVAAMMARDTVVGPYEEAKMRIRTYLNLGEKKDPRNLSFLRTAWRAEKDPAVRAVVADAMYRSSPEDSQAIRALLDSFSANEDVYGRLRKVAVDLQMGPPAVPSLVELAAEGHPDAVSRLLELAAMSTADQSARASLGQDLAEVAKTAPDELIAALKALPAKTREPALGTLAHGLVALGENDHPFWPALKKSMGAVDRELAAFAKELEGTLAVRIAEAKAPEVPVVPVARPSTDKPSLPPTAETRPGG
jgi:D-alanyl-D-alanine carboxypeptidase/D-alanyl-D-alanine-endopeptidase (penicillin-binding protein 4)